LFDPLLSRIRQLESGVRISIPIALDNEGYYDRICPSAECGAEFKVLFEDWRSSVRDEVVYCPTCRFEAAAPEWHNPAQRSQICEAGLRYARGEIEAGLAQSAQEFNRAQPRDGFISMRMSHEPSALPVLMPMRAAELLRQRWTCEECQCRYASLGAAFFCPSCGHNSAVATFDHTIATVRKSVDAIPSLSALLERGEASDLARRIVEDGFVKLVGTFQRFAEASYAAIANAAPARPNAFQSIDEASDLWRDAIGVGYADLLSPEQMRGLTRAFQQRHLLAHCEGIVDQKYLDRSGDSAYRLGQRIVVRADDTRALADLLSDMARKLRAAIARR